MTNDRKPGEYHDIAYQDMLHHILEKGESHEDRTGVGTTSVFGYQNRFDLSERFPLLTIKKMALKSIITELRWFLAGETDVKWLQDRGCHIWDEWATAEKCAEYKREAGDLGPVYGWSWRHFGADQRHDRWNKKNPDNAQALSTQGVDQIAVLCDQLVKNPVSRRLIVTAWDPAVAADVSLPPCHSFFQCKVRKDPTGNSKGILDLHMYQRSADSFLGVPFNIASYALLLSLLAHTHGFKRGDFIHSFGDLHIYNNHRDQVKTVIGRVPFSSPKLLLSDEIKDRGFQGVLDFKFEHVALVGYEHHDAVKAEVAV